MQKNWKNIGKIEEGKKSLEKLWTFFGKSKKKLWSD